MLFWGFKVNGVQSAKSWNFVFFKGRAGRTCLINCLCASPGGKCVILRAQTKKYHVHAYTHVHACKRMHKVFTKKLPIFSKPLPILFLPAFAGHGTSKVRWHIDCRFRKNRICLRQLAPGCYFKGLKTHGYSLKKYMKWFSSAAELEVFVYVWA